MAARMKTSFGNATLLLCTLASLVQLVTAPNPVQAQAESQNALTQTSDPISTYKEAGADAGQQQKIMTLANNYEKAQDEKAHELINELKHLKALSLSANLDEKTILQTQSGINKLQSEMAMDKMHLLINIRRILNQEQRNRLVEIMQRNARQNSSHGAQIQ